LLVHLCVRQTLAWEDEDLVRVGIIPSFRQKFEMWNATFTMPYHLFRVRLKHIAMDSFRRVEGAVVSEMSQVPEGDVIVPIDDDDWLAPDLATSIGPHLHAGTTLVVWKSHVLERRSWIRRVRHWTGQALRRPDRTCRTNNYAVRWRRDRTEIALNHMRATDYADAHPNDVARIDQTLAIQNRSLASQTALAFGRPAIRRDELIRELRAYRNRYADWIAAPPLAWAQPYVDRMNDLMAEVAVK
jgi:hypothetical protein